MILLQLCIVICSLSLASHCQLYARPLSDIPSLCTAVASDDAVVAKVCWAAYLTLFASDVRPPRRSAAKFRTLDDEELMSSHELSPAVADAYRLVSSTCAEQPVQVTCNSDKCDNICALQDIISTCHMAQLSS